MKEAFVGLWEYILDFEGGPICSICKGFVLRVSTIDTLIPKILKKPSQVVFSTYWRWRSHF